MTSVRRLHNLTPPMPLVSRPQVAPVKVMRSGETRTVLVAGRGPVRTRVGVAIVWMGKQEERWTSEYLRMIIDYIYTYLHTHIYIHTHTHTNSEPITY